MLYLFGRFVLDDILPVIWHNYLVCGNGSLWKCKKNVRKIDTFMKDLCDGNFLKMQFLYQIAGYALLKKNLFEMLHMWL